MNVDLKNSLTWLNSAPPKSQTNNTGAFIGDISNFDGKIAVNVQIGTKTVGDSDGAIAIRVMASATNNISNATNYGSSTVSTTNNTTASGQISVDTRDVVGRYLFYGVTLTGTNSPAYPISVSAVGKAVVQPVQ